jgi:hypothetical protein
MKFVPNPDFMKYSKHTCHDRLQLTLYRTLSGGRVGEELRPTGRVAGATRMWAAAAAARAPSGRARTGHTGAPSAKRDAASAKRKHAVVKRRAGARRHEGL